MKAKPPIWTFDNVDYIKVLQSSRYQQREEKALASDNTGQKGKTARQRRSRADAVAFREQVLAARRRNMSIREIADDLGVTPAYVYQLLR